MRLFASPTSEPSSTRRRATRRSPSCESLPRRRSDPHAAAADQPQPRATTFFIIRITIIYIRIIVYIRARVGGVRDSRAVPNGTSSGSCAPLGVRFITIGSGAGPALLPRPAGSVAPPQSAVFVLLLYNPLRAVRVSLAMSDAPPPKRVSPMPTTSETYPQFEPNS